MGRGLRHPSICPGSYLHGSKTVPISSGRRLAKQKAIMRNNLTKLTAEQSFAVQEQVLSTLLQKISGNANNLKLRRAEGGHSLKVTVGKVQEPAPIDEEDIREIEMQLDLCRNKRQDLMTFLRNTKDRNLGSKKHRHEFGVKKNSENI